MVLYLALCNACLKDAGAMPLAEIMTQHKYLCLLYTSALSIMPATAFAAGDIGTIFFSHTYDSNGNAMRYNSSANIGGYKMCIRDRYSHEDR